MSHIKIISYTLSNIWIVTVLFAFLFLTEILKNYEIFFKGKTIECVTVCWDATV